VAELLFIPVRGKGWKGERGEKPLRQSTLYYSGCKGTEGKRRERRGRELVGHLPTGAKEGRLGKRKKGRTSGIPTAVVPPSGEGGGEGREKKGRERSPAGRASPADVTAAENRREKEGGRGKKKEKKLHHYLPPSLSFLLLTGKREKKRGEKEESMTYSSSTIRPSIAKWGGRPGREKGGRCCRHSSRTLLFATGNLVGGKKKNGKKRKREK